LSKRGPARFPWTNFLRGAKGSKGTANGGRGEEEEEGKPRLKEVAGWGARCGARDGRPHKRVWVLLASPLAWTRPTGGSWSGPSASPRPQPPLCPQAMAATTVTDSGGVRIITEVIPATDPRAAQLTSGAGLPAPTTSFQVRGFRKAQPKALGVRRDVPGCPGAARGAENPQALPHVRFSSAGAEVTFGNGQASRPRSLPGTAGHWDWGGTWLTAAVTPVLRRCWQPGRVTGWIALPRPSPRPSTSSPGSSTSASGSS